MDIFPLLPQNLDKGLGNRLMLKSPFFAVRTMLFLATLLIGNSAFAANPASAAIDFFSPLQMPRYEQWRKLSPQAREEFIEDVQAFLMRADAMARSGDTAKSSPKRSHDAQIIQRLFDLWIETAEAQTKSSSQQQPYCINQGVVKPLSECNTKLGYKMHDFDTNEKLSALGGASQCQAPEKPCSPFFGFTAEGQMFCSSLNLTRDCAQKSAQPGTITLASTLAACEKGSPGTPKVDCGKLKAFFDEQMSAVDHLCKDAPKRFACGILKEQIQAVMAEKEGKAPAASQAPASDAGSNAASDADENKVPGLADHIKDAVKMEANKGPCPPEQAAKATTLGSSAPAATQSDSKVQCAYKPFPTKMPAPVFNALIGGVSEGATKDAVCGEMDLPNHGSFKFNFANQASQIRASAIAAPVTLDQSGAIALSFASNILLNSGKVPANKLLDAYLPKEVIKDAGKITVSAKDSKETKDYSATGLVSTDGTQIHYALTDNDVLLLTIKRAGDSKEAFFNFDLKKIQEQAKAQRAAPTADGQ